MILADRDPVVALHDEDQFEDAVLWMIRVLFVECRENSEVFFTWRNRRPIDRRTSNAEKFCLSREYDVFVVTLDEQCAIRGAMGQIFFGAKPIRLLERRQAGAVRRAPLSELQ